MLDCEPAPSSQSRTRKPCEEEESAQGLSSLVVKTHSTEYNDVGLDLDPVLGDDLVALDVDDRVVLQQGNLGVVE